MKKLCGLINWSRLPSFVAIIQQYLTNSKLDDRKCIIINTTILFVRLQLYNLIELNSPLMDCTNSSQITDNETASICWEKFVKLVY